MENTITFYKARKYLLLPTPEQEAKLRMWATALIPVWNDGVRFLKHNKRMFRAGINKPAQIQRSHVGKVFMDLKRAFPDSDWALIPSYPVTALSNRFDAAVQEMYKKTRGAPKFKNADEGLPSLEFPVWDRGRALVVFGRDSIRIPNPNGRKEQGLGRVRYVQRQKLAGKAKTAAILYENGQWFISVSCEITAKPREAGQGAVGLDLGIAQHVATSDGEFISFVDDARRVKLAADKLRIERAIARSEKGSKRRALKVKQLSVITAKLANMRNTAQHVVARQLVDNNGYIAMESLKVKNMTRSAKGDTQNPGKNVRAKSGLNRELANVGMYAFRQKVEQKMARTKGVVVLVDPKNTSRECAVCHHVDAGSRRDQATFVCTSCGHENNADINGAQVILHRARSGEGDKYLASQKAKAAKRETTSRKARREAARAKKTAA